MTPPAYNTFDPEDERKYFLEGIELFNAGEFFEAHEVWEEVWRMSTGDKARFYQGLIQGAVVLEHMNRNNPRGVQAVWKTMLTKFAGQPRVVMGVDLEKFVSGLKSVVGHVLEMETARGQQPHDVRLEWDRAAVPRIELLGDPFVQ